MISATRRSPQIAEVQRTVGGGSVASAVVGNSVFADSSQNGSFQARTRVEHRLVRSAGGRPNEQIRGFYQSRNSPEQSMLNVRCTFAVVM